MPPTFQAVALEFDAPSDFRSRCLVLWGPVRTFASMPGEGEDKIRAATAQMEEDLKELLVEGETHQDRMRIARVAELIAADAGDHTLGAWSQVGRQVGQAGDVAGVAGGHGQLGAVAGEQLDVGLRRLAGVDQLGHVRLVGRGEHVGRLAAHDVVGEARARAEVDRDLHALVP